ncbi:MAG: DUF427 domain-containing protein [Rubellimicrobium sp.]|nr:DUF427 domain-containing protein [Rubellimicrobium sp.]
MADHITLRPAPGAWVIRAGGAVLGETTRAIELSEAGLPPVIYFPREDLAMAFLEPSPSVSRCPYKGQADYLSIITEGGTITDAAWSYADPLPGLEAIRGLVAFYPAKAAVEQL